TYPTTRAQARGQRSRGCRTRRPQGEVAEPRRFACTVDQSLACRNRANRRRPDLAHHAGNPGQQQSDTRRLFTQVKVVVAFVLASLTLAVQATDRYFDSAGVRILYVERAAGTPVFLTHGFTGAVQCCWIDNGILPALARAHRVIALALRGHGLSDKPHEPAAYDEIGTDVIRLLDHLGV